MRGVQTVFHDIDPTNPDTYYAKSVSWAYENGIIKGVEPHTFAPGALITREQMAAMLYRFAQTKGKGFTGSWMFLLNFNDARNVSSYADEAVHWCVMNGLLEGVSGGRLLPQGMATRAQVVTVLYRFFELI